MAVTAKLFANFPHLLLEDKLAGSILDQTIKVALCTSGMSAVLAQATNDYWDDLVPASWEVANGNGYTTGGATLASKTCTLSSLVTTFDAADTAWAASTITARYAVIYYATGTAATSLLIGYVDFGADQASSSGTFQITWNASGIFTITVA
jgi:hypothetical protein